MTFITAEQRASSAPNGNRLGMPAHLEALIYKDLKPINWRNECRQLEQLTKNAERENKLQRQQKKKETERKRREKIAQFEIDRKRNADFYNRAQLKIDEISGEVTYRNAYLQSTVRCDRLISIFCRAFTADLSELMDKGRKIELVKHRQILMWILHESAGQTYSSIARKFGRDHSTVMHSVKKVHRTECLLKLAEEMQATVLFLEREAYGDE